MDSRGPIDQALGLAMMVSPTGKEQQAFVLLIQEARADGLDSDGVLEHLVGAIHDGLSKGNWPKLDTDKAEDCDKPECFMPECEVPSHKKETPQ
jgi:hypothetical protein